MTPPYQVCSTTLRTERGAEESRAFGGGGGAGAGVATPTASAVILVLTATVSVMLDVPVDSGKVSRSNAIRTMQYGSTHITFFNNAAAIACDHLIKVPVSARISPQPNLCLRFIAS